MKKLEIPSIDQVELYDAFGDLQYRDFIEESSSQYASYFENLSALLDKENAKMEADPEYKDYMKKLYSRLSHSGYKKLYRYYTRIRSSSAYCPYCNFPTHSVRQVDHYFPKGSFPSLALTVKNLVPICMDCNNLKLEYYSSQNEGMLIHPYFDKFVTDSFEFIKCEIIEHKNIGFIFFIQPLPDWDKTTYARIQTHFTKLELGKLYSTDFESDFSAYFEELKELLYELGSSAVKDAIARKLRSYKKSQTKPWLYAGYMAILENPWFFNYYLPQENGKI